MTYFLTIRLGVIELPLGSLVDFFAKLCPANSVKTIKFNAPLDFLESERHVFAEFTNEHSFSMYDNNSRTTTVCSGIAASKISQSYTKHISANDLTKS